MARYPLLQEPLRPGRTTLRKYGQRIGRSPEYIRVEWGPRQGFPAPVGELAARGRHGGGRGELVYYEEALDAFRASQADLWGRRTGTVVVIGRSLDERVTLEDFADNIAHENRDTVARYQVQGGFPAAGPNGRYRLGDLVNYWNTRPLLITDRNPDEWMTLGYFADKVVGKSRKTVTQYRDEDGFPTAGPDGRYRLGDLMDFWNAGRPGKRGPGASKNRAA